MTLWIYQLGDQKVKKDLGIWGIRHIVLKVKD